MKCSSFYNKFKFHLYIDKVETMRDLRSLLEGGLDKDADFVKMTITDKYEVIILGEKKVKQKGLTLNDDSTWKLLFTPISKRLLGLLESANSRFEL